MMAQSVLRVFTSTWHEYYLFSEGRASVREINKANCIIRRVKPSNNYMRIVGKVLNNFIVANVYI
jgi:hypothetical protein